MKRISETIALAKLHLLQSEFARQIRGRYEHRAKDCSVCETPGACCLDAHFVNVRITRLEARAIWKILNTFSDEKRRAVMLRVDDAIETYNLNNPVNEFYQCPLFEKEAGCLVHDRAKPLPCIAHACYENKEDLPPEELLVERERRVDKLNRLTYGKAVRALPLPIAIRRND